jgi:hypothetical protein
MRRDAPPGAKCRTRLFPGIDSFLFDF